MSTKNMSSSIDEFLQEEDLVDEVQTQAIQEVAAWQFAQAMKKKHPSKNRVPGDGRPASGDSAGLRRAQGYHSTAGRINAANQVRSLAPGVAARSGARFSMA